MRLISAMALVWALWILPTALLAFSCKEQEISVSGTDNVTAAGICQSADAAIAYLGQCALEVPLPLNIHVTSTLPEGCLGLFHCERQLIELPHPIAIHERLEDDSPFHAISAPALFDSIVVHELTHAAYEGAPCPYADCRATAEYLAYGMQLRSLPPKELVAFRETIIEPRIIKRDEINLIFLMMAPSRFAQKAYQHLDQRPDPCGYVSHILKGDIVFDYVPF